MVNTGKAAQENTGEVVAGAAVTEDTEARVEATTDVIGEQGAERISTELSTDVVTDIGNSQELETPPDPAAEPPGELVTDVIAGSRNGLEFDELAAQIIEQNADTRKGQPTGNEFPNVISPTTGKGASLEFLPAPPSVGSDTTDAAHFSRLTALQAAHLLYEAVQSEDLARFSVLLARCTGQPDIIDYSHGDGFTCLQYACDHRLDEFVDLLLEAGADPAAASPASGKTALHWAAAKDADILRLVVERAPPDAVNAQDALRCTPLHHAAQAGSAAAVRVLLRAGADVSARDDLGHPLLHSLPADVLHEFLDECVRGKRDGEDPEFGIEFDYTLMWPQLPPGQTSFEMAAVYHMADSEDHLPLLSHPLIWSFLELRWWAASSMIAFVLFYYSLFLALLTVLVFLRVEHETLHDNWAEFDRVVAGLYWATVGVTVPMIAAKTVQFIAAPARFFIQWEDAVLKTPVLVMAAVYLLKGPHPVTSEGVLDPLLSLSSILILFAWAQMFVLLIRVPSFAIYAKMYTTVFKRFLWFMLWYGVIIVGLGISMFIVFRDSKGSGNFGLSTPGLALLRTLVMVLDRMEINTLPLEHCRRTSNGTRICQPSDDSTTMQLLFVLCLFFGTVVLTNLLNGLAISDTAALRGYAVSVSLASRARMLAYTESLLLDKPFHFLGAPVKPLGALGLGPDGAPVRCLTAISGLRQLRTKLARWLGLSRRLPDRRLWVFPNKEHKRTSPALPTHWTMDDDVLERARELVLRKGRALPELERQVTRLERQVLERTVSCLGC